MVRHDEQHNREREAETKCHETISISKTSKIVEGVAANDRTKKRNGRPYQNGKPIDSQ